MLALARVSRRKSEELRRNGVGAWYPALLSGRFSGIDGFKIYFFAAQPKLIELVGRVLAGLVIAFVVVTIVGIAIAIAIAKINV